VLTFQDGNLSRRTKPGPKGAGRLGCSANNISVENLWIIWPPSSLYPHIQHFGCCFHTPRTRSVREAKNTNFPGLLPISEPLEHSTESPKAEPQYAPRRENQLVCTLLITPGLCRPHQTWRSHTPPPRKHLTTMAQVGLMAPSRPLLGSLTDSREGPCERHSACNQVPPVQP
jgi:hypothetical protein